MHGHDVEIAHDGSRAVATALQFRPHVVLLDIGLPGMDGFEVVREFRGHPDLASMIVVLDAGFNDHLTKPVEIAKIEDILATVRA
jgi:DNA-binding response OmpR family regulator